MRPTEIVGAAQQIHPRVRGRQPMRRVATFACQGRQSLAHRAIEAFNERGIEHAAPARDTEQRHRARHSPMGHSPGDVGHVVLDGMFDHRANVQLWPDL